VNHLANVVSFPFALRLLPSKDITILIFISKAAWSLNILIH